MLHPPVDASGSPHLREVIEMRSRYPTAPAACRDSHGSGAVTSGHTSGLETYKASTLSVPMPVPESAVAGWPSRREAPSICSTSARAY